MPRGRKPHSAKEFWDRVDVRGKDDCWEWKLAKSWKGYGRVSMNGLILKAHRVAFSLYNDIPDGMHVLHKCDNRACCNPRHLFLGTNADNMRDKKQKGRAAKGENHHKSVLTKPIVRFIKQSCLPQRRLADIFGVSQSNISSIKTGKSWRHVR